MKKLLLGAALGATVLAGAAGATQSTPPAAPLPPPPGALAAKGADANRDGVVTRAEAAADADRRFAALDANRDGTLTRDEMRAARDARRAARQPAPPPAAGKPGDDRPWFGPAGGGRGDRAGKGRDLSQSAFRDRALHRFDRMDADHDGRVTAQERDAFRMTMRARAGGTGDAPPPPPPPADKD